MPYSLIPSENVAWISCGWGNSKLATFAFSVSILRGILYLKTCAIFDICQKSQPSTKMVSKKSSRNFVVSKKFSRNFSCQNNSSFVEKSQPLTRNCVEKIQLKFLLPKQSQIVEKSQPLTRNHVEKIQSKFCLSKQFSYICQNTCRKYSGSHLMFENCMSKFFSKRSEK